MKKRFMWSSFNEVFGKKKKSLDFIKGFKKEGEKIAKKSKKKRL